MDEKSVIQMFFTRDENAVKEVQSAYGTALTRLSKRILCNERDAEECVNDTYLNAWNSIPPNNPEGYLFAYLAKITRNLSLNLLKKRSRECVSVELTAEMEECIPSPSDAECAVDDAEFGRVISVFLRSVSAESRLIFLRRYWYFCEISEISRMMGVSEAKVKSSLFRTRNKLRDYLTKEGIII